MTDLGRFEGHRFLGDRSTMTVYDTEDAGQRRELASRISEHGLLGRNQIQTFGPDSAEEALNRGFRPPRRRVAP